MILGEALRLVDEHGMEALSMRRLAAELGVDPMAIYHHLPGKDAVISGLVGTVFAGMRVPQAESIRWQDRVRDFAWALRGLVRAHPNLALHVIRNAAVGVVAALEASEVLYEALEASGLPPQTVLRTADLVVDYVNGFALAEFSGPLGQPGDRRELLAQLEERPAERFPAMRRVLGALSDDELRVDFEFGLDVILSGLERIAGRADEGLETLP